MTLVRQEKLPAGSCQEKMCQSDFGLTVILFWHQDRTGVTSKYSKPAVLVLSYEPMTGVSTTLYEFPLYEVHLKGEGDRAVYLQILFIFRDPPIGTPSNLKWCYQRPYDHTIQMVWIGFPLWLSHGALPWMRMSSTLWALEAMILRICSPFQLGIFQFSKVLGC